MQASRGRAVASIEGFVLFCAIMASAMNTPEDTDLTQRATCPSKELEDGDAIGPSLEEARRLLRLVQIGLEKEPSLQADPALSLLASASPQEMQLYLAIAEIRQERNPGDGSIIAKYAKRLPAEMRSEFSMLVAAISELPKVLSPEGPSRPRRP